MEQRIKATPSGEPLWSARIHKKGAALGLPIAGNFELTPRCNFRCRMCYVHENAGDAMSADDWIALGKTARDRGMVFLLLTGGEPFIRRDFAEIYRGLTKLGLMISINTNASLLNEEIFAALDESHPIRMNISLYGTSEDTYESLCGVRCCETVKENIRRLHEAGIPIKINSSLTPYNAHDLEGIYAFAKSLGLPITGTAYMYPPVRLNGCSYGDAPARFTAEEAAAVMLRCREQLLTPEQLKGAAAGILPDEELCADDGIPGEGERMRCRAGRTAFWLTWDGRMLPCGMFPDEGYDVRALGFDAAWQKVRERAAGIRMPRECTDCPKKNRCAACAAACIAETGESSCRPDYICRMTNEYDRILMEKYR